MNKNKTVYGVGLILFLGLAISSQGWLSESQAPSVHKPQRPPENLAPTSPPSTESEAPSSQAPRSAASVTLEVDPQFQSWFSAEAQQIEAQNVDSLATETQLKEKASGFGRPHVAFLASRASSPDVPATERILASYLLSLAAETSSSELVDLASLPIKHSGPHEPHSIDEAKAVQERALRLMSIDAIVSREGEIQKKLQDLQKVIQQAQDVSVQKYAQQKIDELNSQQ